MTVEAGTYESVQNYRRELLGLAEREASIIEALGVETHRELINSLRARITSDTFKILVLGDFRQGKSTFVNALLGEQVLPSFAYPTTAIVNEVKFGEERRAVLHPLAVNGLQAAPIDIPIADLDRYVTIDDNDPDKRSPYERADVYWPLELCRNGVEIADSPGLNEDAARTEVTVTYLAQADAVIFVLNAERFLALNEQQFIELYLAPLGQDNVIYVTNKINRIEPEERDGVIRRARQRAEPYIGREDRLFFVNAKGGLRARREADAQGWAASGLAEVEGHLERFLVESRGRAKILGPARELRSAMTQIRKDLRARDGMLDLDREELSKRYADAQQPLRQLERRRAEIVQAVDNHNVATRQEALQAVRRKMEEIADRAGEFVAEIETENKLTLNPLTATAARERFTTELVEKVSHRMRVTLSEWLADGFQKLMLERADNLEKHIGRDLEDFARKIDQIRFELNEVGAPDPGKEPSGGQRLAAAITGLLLVDVTTAYTGSMYGFKEMAKSAVPRLAIIFTGVALAINPLVILGLLLGTALLEGLIRKGGAEKRLRAAVAEQSRDELHGRAQQDAEAVVSRLDEQLNATRTAVSTALSNELEAIRAQVEGALKEKATGEGRVLNAKKELAAYAEELDKINEGLDDLIHRVVA